MPVIPGIEDRKGNCDRHNPKWRKTIGRAQAASPACLTHLQAVREEGVGEQDGCTGEVGVGRPWDANVNPGEEEGGHGGSLHAREVVQKQHHQGPYVWRAHALRVCVCKWYRGTYIMHE
eukprot:1159285-Pelagomonas_calceolata.AAC.4